jgi:hypothetical protein
MPDCQGCDECKTTLAQGPELHRDIAPHEWQNRWTVDKVTGQRGKERICLHCYKHEPLPHDEPAPGPA